MTTTTKWSNNEALPAAFHPKGLRMPGISEESRRKTADLIKKNHYSHHCFFNQSGFHNHTIHHVLAAYSLGAPPARLEEIYQDNAKIQMPIGPLQNPPITRGNWGDYLGRKEYYPNYLDFFRDEINTRGAEDVLADYLFSEESAEYHFFVRFMGGVYHNLIHVGYGLEFSSPLVVAEGLAMAACHQAISRPLFESPQESTSISLPGLKIIEDIFQDKGLDGVVSWEDPNKMEALLSRGAEKVVGHTERWKVPPDQIEGKARELMELSMALYAGSSRPGKEIVLDFFLMHSLTSSLFLPILAAHLSPQHSAKIIHAHFVMTAAFYVSRGRPRVFPLGESALSQKTNPWLDIIDRALSQEDCHLLKAVRSLAFGAVEGEAEGEREGEREREGEEICQKEKSWARSWAKAGLMSVEGIRDGNWWNQDGIGFDQVWEGRS